MIPSGLTPGTVTTMAALAPLPCTVTSASFFSEPILGGKAQIEGSFKAEEAKQLAQVLRYGALPVTLNIAESTSISPTLGQDQLSAGLLAGAIGLALVVIYLLIYYRALGFVGSAARPPCNKPGVRQLRDKY